MNLNEETLRRGLGKTVLVKGLNYDSKIYWKIHRNLLKAELTALKKEKEYGRKNLKRKLTWKNSKVPEEKYAKKTVIF